MLDYKKAIKLDLNNAADFYGLGSIHWKNEETDLTIEYFEKGLKTGQTHHIEIYLFNLRTMYQKKGDMKKAISYFQKAIEINPHHFQSLNNLGMIFRQPGLYDQAFHYVKAGFDSRPDDVEIINNIGYTYYRKKMFEEANKYFEKALQISSSHGLCHYKKALHPYTNKQFDLAIEHLDKAVENGYQGSPKFHAALQAYRKMKN